MNGQVIGGYRVLRALSKGGMGAIYEVEGPGRARLALKTLLFDGLGISSDPELFERFRREGELLGRLDHPHVVRIHAAEFAGPLPYLVQDLLTGGTLSDRLRGGPLAEAEAVAIVLKLAGALEHAHERGVLHRDLKPENVMFDDRGEPRLVDFGIGLGLDISRMSVTGEVIGTPQFMAPEQALANKEIDARTDVYGLGAVLYALLTGCPPIEASSALMTMDAVVNRPPVNPTRLNPNVSRALAGVCLRALAKDAADRYSSMGAFAEALCAPPAPERAPRTAVMALGALLGLTVLAIGAWTGLRGGGGEAVANPPPTLTPNSGPADEPPSAGTNSLWTFQQGDRFCWVLEGEIVIDHAPRQEKLSQLSMALAAEVVRVESRRVYLESTIAALRMRRSIRPGTGALFGYDSLADDERGLDLSPALHKVLTLEVDLRTGAILGIQGVEALHPLILDRIQDTLEAVGSEHSQETTQQLARDLSGVNLAEDFSLLTRVVPPEGATQTGAWRVASSSGRPLMDVGHLPLEIELTLGRGGKVTFQGTSPGRPPAKYVMSGAARFTGGRLVNCRLEERYKGVLPHGDGEVSVISRSRFRWLNEVPRAWR